MLSPERPTLLLIHGYPLDRTMWTGQLEGLRDAAKVIAPDLRGFGVDTREIPAVMRMEDHAMDLKELLDEEHVAQVILCGLSMGGYIAMAFLERWPERVIGLILANTKSTADDATAKAAREESARNAVEKGMPVVARGMVPKLLSEHTRREQPELVRSVEVMIAGGSAHAAAASARGMALRPDRSEWLQSLTIPTLVITGDADELMPLATSQAMADAIPNAALCVIPEAGHLSNMEQPEAFNTAIRKFITDACAVDDTAVEGEEKR